MVPGIPSSRRLARRALAVGAGLVLALAAAELVLRAGGNFTTYSERNFGTYREVFGREQQGWLHAWTPGVPYTFRTPEFTLEYEINADGVRDVTHALEPEPGRRRIVVLGDSFTEGAGAQRHESWPWRMGELIEAAGVPVEVFNAGMSGSDPCFEYQLLRQRFLRYRPDLVIVSLNASDVLDTVWWGGMERFQADGTTRGAPRQPWSRLYRHSHLARWYLQTFAKLDPMTLAYGHPGKRSWEAQLKIVDALQAIADLRAQQPFELLVLVHPLPRALDEAQVGYYEPFFEEVERREVRIVNLARPIAMLLAGLEFEQFAWPIDCHFNARGYEAFAQAVAPLAMESLERVQATAAAPERTRR